MKYSVLLSLGLAAVGFTACTSTNDTYADSYDEVESATPIVQKVNLAVEGMT